MVHIHLSRKFLMILFGLFVVGATIIGVNYSISASTIEKIRETSFDSEVEIFTNVLKNSINTQIRNVKTLYILFEYQDRDTDVDIELFNNVTDEFLINEQSSRAYSYAPKVVNENRYEFEKKQSLYWKPILDREITIRSLNSKGEMETSQNKTEYYPVTYINPVIGNQGAILFDLYSVENRKTTIDNAVYYIGNTIFTPKIILVQDNEIGFLTVTCNKFMCITSVIRMRSLLEETYLKSILKDNLIVKITETDTNEFLGCIKTYESKLEYLNEEKCSVEIRDNKYFESNTVLDYESENLHWSIFIVSTNDFELISLVTIAVNSLILSLFVVMISCLYVFLHYREGVNQIKLRDELRKAYNKWVGYMCHALRGPIHIVDYSIETLIDENGFVNIKKYEILKANSDRLGNLINSYIDIGAIEADKLKLVKRSVDVCEIVHNIYHEYSIMSSDTVQFNIFISKEMLGVHLKLDPLRFRQIISCGVENAYKFTKRGNIQIKIEHVGNCVEFIVIDTGPGVCDGDMDKLFEEYERGNIMNKRVPGSGLGLIMSSKIATMMKGTVTLSNRDDGTKGSVFKLALPYNPVAPSDSDDSITESPDFPKRVEDLVIHICEDEKHHREILAEMMDNIGIKKHNLMYFDDGELLIDYYKRYKILFPDVVILDIYMKNMNGDTAFQEMKKMGYTGCGIVVTGDIQNIGNYIDIGFHKIITKPYRIDQIRNILEKSLKIIHENELELFEV